jgi:hypothetical protein
MFLSKDDWINQRAYGLWETDGRPEGRGAEHWQQATLEYQMLERTRASVDGSELIERLKTMGRQMRDADRDNAVERAPVSLTIRRSAG